MPHFAHIAAHLPTADLLAAITAQPELFGQHPQRTSAPGSPHCLVSAIRMRYNDLANRGSRFNHEHDSVWYPA